MRSLIPKRLQTTLTVYNIHDKFCIKSIRYFDRIQYSSFNVANLAVDKYSWAGELLQKKGVALSPDASKAPSNITLSDPPSEKVISLTNQFLLLNVIETKQLMQLLQEMLDITDVTISDQISKNRGGMDMGTNQVESGASAAVTPTEVAPVVEKTAFDLKLTLVDAKAKIKIIKEVRSITGLGLKEAKDLVEKAPVIIKQGLKKEEVENFKKLLVDVGAQVEIL